MHVADVNDHAPIFDKEHYEVDVKETAPVGSRLLRLKVSDLDQGRNAQVTLPSFHGFYWVLLGFSGF